MRIISFINQKGGVAKTTSVINLGDALHRSSKKVLLIDLDPQAHLTYSLGIQAHDLSATVYELLKGSVTWQDALIHRSSIDVLPSSLDLSGAEIELSGIPGRELLLREHIEKSAFHYDYILIDCPPSLGLLTLNALVAAREIFIPMQPEFLSLRGVGKLLQVVEIIRSRLNPVLRITGVIATRYNNRRNLDKEIMEKIHSYFGDRVFQTVIRENVALAEAPSFGQTIFEYRPQSNGAEDYEKLCREVLFQE